MTDTRQDLAKAVEALAGLATQAAYVAVGVGVIKLQKAQACHQKATKAHKSATERPGGFDANIDRVIKLVDETFDPYLERMPAPAQSLVHQARWARDQLRKLVLGAV
jgi:hypothetical protein